MLGLLIEMLKWPRRRQGRAMAEKMSRARKKLEKMRRKVVDTYYCRPEGTWSAERRVWAWDGSGWDGTWME
jgi:hypothetical protein